MKLHKREYVFYYLLAAISSSNTWVQGQLLLFELLILPYFALYVFDLIFYDLFAANSEAKFLE